MPECLAAVESKLSNFRPIDVFEFVTMDFRHFVCGNLTVYGREYVRWVGLRSTFGTTFYVTCFQRKCFTFMA